MTALKISALEIFDQDFNTSMLTHVYTYVSPDPYVRKGRSRIHIHSRDSITLKIADCWYAIKQLPGQAFCPTESCQISQCRYTTPISIVFSTDYESAVQYTAVTQKASGKRETAPSLWPAAAELGKCPFGLCSQ